MPLSLANQRLAREVLGGASLQEASSRYGVTRGRAWQVVRAFCLEWMLAHERTGKDGKLKNLKGLRHAWANWMRV